MEPSTIFFIVVSTLLEILELNLSKTKLKRRRGFNPEILAPAPA